jgi:uncharacterized integral membrane protein
MRRPDGSEHTLTPRMLMAIGAAALALVFIAENTKTTDIRFIVPKVESPIWLALLVTFLIGAVAGWFFARSFKKG